jgi:hypothetical protein
MTFRDVDLPTQDTATGVQPDHRTLAAGETKGAWKTTELWATIAGVVALIVAYNVAEDVSLDLFRACLLCTVLGVAYIVSRGLAKSGSRPEQLERRDPGDRVRRF